MGEKLPIQGAASRKCAELPPNDGEADQIAANKKRQDIAAQNLDLKYKVEFQDDDDINEEIVVDRYSEEESNQDLWDSEQKQSQS